MAQMAVTTTSNPLHEQSHVERVRGDHGRRCRLTSVAATIESTVRSRFLRRCPRGPAAHYASTHRNVRRQSDRRDEGAVVAMLESSTRVTSIHR